MVNLQIIKFNKRERKKRDLQVHVWHTYNLIIYSRERLDFNFFQF